MKKKEICTVIRQKEIGDGIFSMWIQTENIGKEAKPGQFVSLYSKDGSKLLPRPISLCEIDRENSRLRLVYRVTGAKTGTEEFSRLKAGDTIPVIGPLGNGFPVEKAEGKRAFLMGGGIGVPPILELAKQMQCEKKQIVVGYRNAQTFLKEEFEAAGELYISTEDGSVGTWMRSGNRNWKRISSMPVVRHRCFGLSNSMQRKMVSNVISHWKSAWHAVSVPAWPVSANQKKKMHTAT